MIPVVSVSVLCQAPRKKKDSYKGHLLDCKQSSNSFVSAASETRSDSVSVPVSVLSRFQ